ncbi:MAG TPA: cyclase family protein [Acidobacteria bacterium]|nr:cyclase family protein [Acidobacteriota bacterium]
MRRMDRAGGLVVALMMVCGSATTAGAQSEPGAEVTKAQYDAWMTELSNWGRWGDDDELGALNLITPAKRLEAASLVTRGTVVSMAREMTIERLDDPDQASANRPPVLVGSSRSVFDINTEGGYFWERYEIEYHGSAVSHLDALCHVAYNGKVYNGLDFEEVASKEDGCTRMGVANLREGLITRGILIDMPGRAVRRADIEAWEAETGITISPGDALFLRTGRDIGERGGYHPSLIPFFKERDIALLGADVPQEGGQVDGVTVPVHFFALVALGVHLFDNLGLEDLAETANELNQWEFMFMASPHVVPNGAGSAINPLAVF